MNNELPNLRVFLVYCRLALSSPLSSPHLGLFKIFFSICIFCCSHAAIKVNSSVLVLVRHVRHSMNSSYKINNLSIISVIFYAIKWYMLIMNLNVDQSSITWRHRKFDVLRIFFSAETYLSIVLRMPIPKNKSHSTTTTTTIDDNCLRWKKHMN